MISSQFMADITKGRARQARHIHAVLLRLPATLHRALTRQARAGGRSFNEWCVQRLGEAIDPPEGDPRGIDVGRRAQRLFGSAFVGMIAIGSVVRGDAAADSDLDLLIVLNPQTPISRALYRVWDAEGDLTINDRLVDAHFIALPAETAPATAVWAEAAIEGELWLDRDGGVTRQLARARRDIADGRLVRRTMHGHSYWKEVA